MRPGISVRPLASMTVAPSGAGIDLAILLILLPSISTLLSSTNLPLLVFRTFALAIRTVLTGSVSCAKAEVAIARHNTVQANRLAKILVEFGVENSRAIDKALSKVFVCRTSHPTKRRPTTTVAITNRSTTARQRTCTMVGTSRC